MTSRRSNKSESVAELDDEATVVADAVADPAADDIIEAQAVHLDDDAAEKASVVGSAADAIRHGAASAKAAVGEVVPGVGRLVRKTVYGTFYCASYGVVFAALSVARLVPTDNVLGEALRDGAQAARHDVEHVAVVEDSVVMEEAEAVLPA